LKRATRTPNRFITSTRSWLVKGLALFFILLALGSCEENLGLIGSKKPTSRFAVYFKEFDIPVTTVQADSLNSSAFSSERLLCGVASDPNFGKVNATAYTMFRPAVRSKIDQTGKSNFEVEGITLNFILTSDYYVYGDTANSTLDYTIHRVSNDDYWLDDQLFTKTELDYDPTEIASGSFEYKHDSIVDHRKRQIDSDNTDTPVDSIFFQLPNSLGQQLLDTALAKGVYHFNSEGVWEYSAQKSDSVFFLAFRGLVLKSSDQNNKVLSLKSCVATLARTSRITLYYSYIKAGVTVHDKLYYFNSTLETANCTGLGFSNIKYDRTGTALENLTSFGVDYNAPDDYAYLQSGTGAFAKLDLSEVHAYFDANPDTILNMAINSAELTVDIESVAVRQHQNMPNYLLFRVVNTSNRFLRVPTIEVDGVTGEVGDPQYGINYNSLLNGTYLDARDDAGNRLGIPLTKSTATSNAFYSAYISDFMQYFLHVPDNFQKVYYMALIPADAPYGKSFHGLSFKKDKVKLRVFYTKTL
jgi:hypothetical protein